MPSKTRKTRKPNRPNVTCKEAVFAALDRIGDQSSGKALAIEASKFTAKKVVPMTAIAVRFHWRKLNGRKTDARTYRGQPERNMTKATAGLNLTLDDVSKAHNLLRKLRLNQDALAKFINEMGGARKANEAVVALNRLPTLGIAA